MLPYCDNHRCQVDSATIKASADLIEALATREKPLALGELANNLVRRMPPPLGCHDVIPPSPKRASESHNAWTTLRGSPQVGHTASSMVCTSGVAAKARSSSCSIRVVSPAHVAVTIRTIRVSMGSLSAPAAPFTRPDTAVSAATASEMRWPSAQRAANPQHTLHVGGSRTVVDRPRCGLGAARRSAAPKRAGCQPGRRYDWRVSRLASPRRSREDPPPGEFRLLRCSRQ